MAAVHFDESSTAEEVLQDIDLTGKNIIVTGATSGIGIETARALALRGAQVTITARDLAKAEPTLADIQHSSGNAQVEAMELELSQPDSIRSFAESWLSAHDKLNALINNAACWAGGPLKRTCEGWEEQFGVNHLGHFLLSSLLLPALRAGAPSRLVCLSSSGHRHGMSSAAAMDLGDLNYENREYDSDGAYCQSKLANIWFAYEFNKRFSSEGIEGFSLDPGSITDTQLAREKPKELIEQMIEGAKKAGKFMKSIPQGAATSVWAATSPALNGKGGTYLNNCQISRLATDDAEGHAPFAYDDDRAHQLWEKSESLIGRTFD